MRRITVDTYEDLKFAKGVFREMRRTLRFRMLYDTKETKMDRWIYFFPAVVTKKPAEDNNLIGLRFELGSTLHPDFLGFLIGKADRVPAEKEND